MARGAWMLVMACLLWCAGTARAEPTLDLAALHGGASITPKSEWYLDTSGKLDFARVSAPDFALFHPPTGAELSLGLQEAPVWLHFRAVNGSAHIKLWLLDLAYPHLDYVTLYLVRGDGQIEHFETGDMLPFTRRPVAQPNFLFPMESQAHETVDLYLRVATTGTLNLPLTAWDMPEFLEHQTETSTGLWMFLGALLMMALYNLAVFVLIRHGEYLTQALLLVSACAAVFAFDGLMFQHVLPGHPELANKAIGLFLTLALSACMLTCAQVAQRVADYEFYRLAFLRAAWVMLGLAGVIMFAPKELGLRLAMVATALCLSGGLLALLALTPRNHPLLRLYVLSWYFPIIGVPVTLLANFGILPPWRLFSWAAYMGCAMQAIFTTLGLASRVKVMGDHLVGLNAQLSSNVVNLEHALSNAKEAREAAQRAVKAKDEFMATMSHELRTPLNAIINVPQGLLEEFVVRRVATCGRCKTEFVLEQGDELDEATGCAECQATGTLMPGITTEYVGEPVQTVRFLQKIERAGQHLLEMVDSVLDFSKMEAGRFELDWGYVDLAAVVRDVADAMSEAARKKGLVIRLEQDPSAPGREGDPLRLKQVLLNLVSNAIKFSERPGTICIRIDWDKERESDVISVKDEGIGIAAEHHERIFARFEQVHRGGNRRFGGTGLGLSISRNLVRLHGGELWVESTPGQGSTFFMRLPRKRPEAETAAAQ